MNRSPRVVLAPLATVLASGLLAGLLSGLMSGCVTINIYFPAAAAEKAADRIIDEIYQTRKDAPAAAPLSVAPALPAPAAKPADTK